MMAPASSARALEIAQAIMRAALLRDPRLALDACMQARELITESPDYALMMHCPWPREGEGESITMRAPCQGCGDSIGKVTRTNGQDVVRCAACDRYAYCAPRARGGR